MKNILLLGIIGVLLLISGGQRLALAQGQAATASATNAAKPVDLTGFFDAKAANFPSITSFPWKDVPTGARTFDGVPVQIDGFFCLWGSATAAAGMQFRKSIAGIPVARKFDALYIYHAAFNDSPEGRPITHVVFHYADGTTMTNDICYGTHARDWYEKPGEALHGATDPKSKVVWRAPNSAMPGPNNFLRCFLTEMANPRPTVEVTALDFVSTEEKAGSCVMALTAGPAGMLKVAP